MKFAGRLILLGINVSYIILFCISGFMLLKMNYKWRKQGIIDYQNSIYYSAILVLIWIFTSIPNLLDEYAIAPLYNKNLKDGLSVVPFIVASVIVAYIAYFLHKKIVSSVFHLQLKYSLLLLTIGVIYWCNRFDGNAKVK